MTPVRCVLVVLLLTARTSSAVAADVPFPPHITVSADAERRVAPDRAVLVLGVYSRSSAVKDTTTANGAIVGGLVSRLAALGIAADQIRTVGVSTWMEYPTGPSGPGVTIGTLTVEVTIDTLASVGPAMTAAVAAGINQIEAIRFELKDRETIYRQLLLEATTKAKARAETLATGLGVLLGVPLEITDQDRSQPYPMRPMAMMGMARSAVVTSAGAGSVPGGGQPVPAEDSGEAFQAGQIELSASVSATFSIATIHRVDP